MEMAVRVFVADAQMQAELGKTQPSDGFSTHAEPPDDGFGETLYPILVEFGVTALPASVTASLIAAWLFEAWRRRGRPPNTIVGFEVGSQVETMALSDADIERIAARLQLLLAHGVKSGDNT